MEHATADGAWQAGRNRLNHDWLKNKFSLTLERAVKIADEKIDDDEFAVRFIRSSLPEFDTELESAHQLIDSFEEAMSPRMLLDREPLCRLSSSHRVWLRQVVHACWRSRIGAAELIDSANRQLSKAMEAGEALNGCIEGRCGTLDGQRLVRCRSELLALRDACQELGNVISRFPNRIRVT